MTNRIEQPSLTRVNEAKKEPGINLKYTRQPSLITSHKADAVTVTMVLDHTTVYDFNMVIESNQLQFSWRNTEELECNKLNTKNIMLKSQGFYIANSSWRVQNKVLTIRINR